MTVVDETETAVVVLSSRVFSFSADTVASVTDIEYALPVPVRVFRVAISLALMVAVTTPEVRSSRVLA